LAAVERPTSRFSTKFPDVPLVRIVSDFVLLSSAGVCLCSCLIPLSPSTAPVEKRPVDILVRIGQRQALRISTPVAEKLRERDT
jgi:hypothetical protein